MENMCTVQVKLELGHRAQLRKKVTTEGFTHDWMVFVRGPEACDIQHFVERVVFRLHDSFPKPKRVCKEPPYKVEESGYAGFLMPIEVYFKNKEEPKKVCFNYDLFLNLEGNPPVNHLRCEKLTFNNPTHEFRRKLVKAGGVFFSSQAIVVPEGAEMMPRPSPDYPMLPTIPLSAFSDPKKIKSSHAVKESSKDGGSGSSKNLKAHKATKEQQERTRKDSESKATSRESDRESKSSRDLSSSSFSKKSTDGRGKDDVKTVPKAAFKEPKLTVRESKMDGMSPKGGGGVTGGGGQVDTRTPGKRPSSATESPKLTTKKQKRIGSEGMKGGGYSSSSPRITSTTPSNYPEKKTTKDKGHWTKMKTEVAEVKRQPESDESNSEDEASSKSESAPSSPSSSSSSSSSDSDFEPSQKQGQGTLRSMVEDMHSEGSDDDSSSEVETPMKTNPFNHDSRLSMDSESDGNEESRPPSQEAPSPSPKLSSANLKMLGKKSPDSCNREKVIKRGYDKAYTEELMDLHRRLMALRERNILQQIVNLIEKTGHFNITNTTFDFDLFSLDESTVRKLQSYLEATST
ncbi:MLLT1 super elongation complex subunit b isoform X4 [Danio aesculapii]|uniref:MLLT1 super elongation complex subunit b isoform X4 n=1 Tax=Danio aesculapii TaxID=1142201 RepID=UPI0024C087A4|nr:MLLT1 super elongation complex subunit b isoform X4 [Danio aesculapii]